MCITSKLCYGQLGTYGLVPESLHARKSCKFCLLDARSFHEMASFRHLHAPTWPRQLQICRPSQDPHRPLFPQDLPLSFPACRPVLASAPHTDPGCRCPFQLIGLAERRLECKEKIAVVGVAIAYAHGTEFSRNHPPRRRFSGGANARMRCAAFRVLRGQEDLSVPRNLRPGGVHMTISRSTQGPGPELEPVKRGVETKLECSVESMGSPEGGSSHARAAVVAPDSPPRDFPPEAGPPFPFPCSQPLQLILPLPWPSLDCRWQHGVMPKLPPKPVPLGRCSEKGCVFPAAGPHGRCRQHQRQWSEPGLYSSHQPTSALVEQGKFGPVRPEWVEDAKAGHTYDRRRMAAEREHFLREQQ